jgi:hypothetical protein
MNCYKANGFSVSSALICQGYLNGMGVSATNKMKMIVIWMDKLKWAWRKQKISGRFWLAYNSGM